jgi:hypothetical protein
MICNFLFDIETWKDSLLPSSKAGGDRYGWSVAMLSDGKWVAIDAIYNGEKDILFLGHTRIYNWIDLM